MEALWIWRQFPKQIASDLHARGLHIKHWLRATRGADGDLILSSYELLYILEFLPEDSAFKTAARGGRWPLTTLMAAETLNEAYRFRASYHAAHSTDENDVRFDPTDWLFIDPVVAQAEAEQERAEAAIAAQTEPELTEAGWM